MDETSLNQALASGGATVEAAEEPQTSESATSSTTFEEFVPMLQELQSVQQYLSAAPTFVPQTWQEQIQLVFMGGIYYLYLYINNQWVGQPLSGSAPVSVNAFSTGCQSSLSSGVATKVQFTANAFANGITWDSVNYQFAIVTAGQYIITGEVDQGTSPATGVFAIGIFVNGSQIAGDKRYVSGSVPVANNITVMANLSVGDKVTLWMSQTSGFVNTLSGAYLGIAKV